MSVIRWAALLLKWIAPENRVEDVLASISARSALQIALGVLVGAGLLIAAGGVRSTTESVALFSGYVFLMIMVCLLACVMPTRRALRIEPTEALREE